MIKPVYISTGSYNKSIALSYINDSILQCDNLDSFNRIIGVIDFITYCQMIDLFENLELRKQLFFSYKKNCSGCFVYL